MKQVVYNGPFDRRDISEADLTRLGVEHPQDYSFTRGGIQEVSNELGEVLLVHGVFFNEFREASEEELKQQELDAAAEALANPQPPTVDDPEALAATGGHVQGATTPSTSSGKRKRASTADQV